MEQLGAKRFAARSDINREDWPAVDAWIEAAVSALFGLQLKSVSTIAGLFSIIHLECQAGRESVDLFQHPMKHSLISIGLTDTVHKVPGSL